jgi:hypothetical protein
MAENKTPEMALAEALVQFQKNCPMVPKSKKAGGPGKDGRPGKTYHFAPFDEVWGVVKEHLAAAGLAVYQTPEREDIRWILRTEILHIGGAKLTGIMPIIYSAGSAQDFGSAFSYARRYGLLGALCIATEDEDDDAQAVSQPTQPRQQTQAQPKPQPPTKAPPKPAEQPKPPAASAEDIKAVQGLYKQYMDELTAAGYEKIGEMAHAHFRQFCNANFKTSIKPADPLRGALTGEIPAAILAMATPKRPFPWQPDETILQGQQESIEPTNEPYGF